MVRQQDAKKFNQQNYKYSKGFTPLIPGFKKIPFNNQGVFKGEVLLNNGLTFYAKYGNLFSKICLLISLICSFLFKIK